MSVPTEVLGALYAQEIAKRGFTADPAQLAAIRHLERLRAELAEAAAAPLGKRLLRGLTSNGAAPKGVYLWGGVGRGKTWIMDLFYASLTIAAKRRTHFYRFMQVCAGFLKGGALGVGTRELFHEADVALWHFAKHRRQLEIHDRIIRANAPRGLTCAAPDGRGVWSKTRPRVSADVRPLEMIRLGCRL